MSIFRISLFTLILLMLSSTACNTMKRMERQEDRRQRKIQRGIEKKKWEEEKAYVKMQKRQKRIQDKETRKRMRQLERQSRRWNENKKEFFLVRWWKKLVYRKAQNPGAGSNDR